MICSLSPRGGHVTFDPDAGEPRGGCEPVLFGWQNFRQRGKRPPLRPAQAAHRTLHLSSAAWRPPWTGCRATWRSQPAPQRWAWTMRRPRPRRPARRARRTLSAPRRSGPRWRCASPSSRRRRSGAWWKASGRGDAHALGLRRTVRPSRRAPLGCCQSPTLQAAAPPLVAAARFQASERQRALFSYGELSGRWHNVRHLVRRLKRERDDERARRAGEEARLLEASEADRRRRAAAALLSPPLPVACFWPRFARRRRHKSCPLNPPLRAPPPSGS